MTSFQIMQERAERIANNLSTMLPKKPDIAIILGSGWSGIIEILQNKIIIPYTKFKEMPNCTVAGHLDNFIYGEFEDKAILLLQGRFHLYEGFDVHTVVLPIQIIKNLKIEKLLLTNASGGVNPNYSVGDVMLLNGHINFTGQNPLIGVQASKEYPIFIDMSTLYKNNWQNVVEKSIEKILPLKKGVYLQTLGPNYETANEIQAFQKWGVDAVGMSTVVEAIYAHYLKMQVVGLAFISNMAAGVQSQKNLSIKEINDRRQNRIKNTAFEHKLNNIENQLLEQERTDAKLEEVKQEKLTHQEVLNNSMEALSKLTNIIKCVLKTL